MACAAILSVSVAQKHARTVILSAQVALVRVLSSFLERSALERGPRSPRSSQSAREWLCGYLCIYIYIVAPRAFHARIYARAAEGREPYESHEPRCADICIDWSAPMRIPYASPPTQEAWAAE